MYLKILIVIFAITFCRFSFSSLRFHITAEVCNCKISTKEQRNHDTAVKRVSWGYAQPRILAIHFSAAFLAHRWIQPISFFSEFHDPIVDQYLQTSWLLKSDKRVIKNRIQRWLVILIPTGFWTIELGLKMFIYQMWESFHFLEGLNKHASLHRRWNIALVRGTIIPNNAIRIITRKTKVRNSTSGSSCLFLSKSGYNSRFVVIIVIFDMVP